MADADALIAELHRTPRSSADELMRVLGIGSQPTFSRLVARAGDRVVAIGKARARRYAAARAIPGPGLAIPVFRVDTTGKLVPVGTIRPIAPAGYVVDGALDGAPSMVEDLRPSGFLGAVFAKRAASFGLPPDPRDWTEDDLLVALASVGEDMPGDLVVGDESARRYYAWHAGDVEPIERGERTRRYPALAEDAIRGVVPGPVVAGEQPKFGAVVAAHAGPRHVLVKFSPSEYSPVARRWCDLLVCEHLALETLRAHGMPAVDSEVLEGGSRVFLETARFDRVGLAGRRAIVRTDASGQAGPLRAFCRLIDDTTWTGRIAFAVSRDDGTLAPAPVHGLAPMGYAPVGGELPVRSYVPPPPDPGGEDAWRTAAGWAVDFWQRVAVEDRVSRGFRTIARENTLAVSRVVTRLSSIR